MLKLAPKDYIIIQYRKIPKISPGAYIFQRPFLRGLFLEGLMFRGAYVWREISISKSIGLACSGKEIYHFCFVLLCIPKANSEYKPLYSEGQFNGGFFALPFWGAYISRGLYMEELIFGILQYNLVTYKCMINTLVTYGSPRTIFIKTNFITVWSFQNFLKQSATPTIEKVKDEGKVPL